jgi:Sec-independent protein secretion pathway component TatC
MALLAIVTGYVQRVYPARAPVYAPWWWFYGVLLVIGAALVALVTLPWWVWQDWHRYDPPLTRSERRRKMRT